MIKDKTLHRILAKTGTIARAILEYIREVREIESEVVYSATFGARPRWRSVKRQSVYNTVYRLQKQGYIKRKKRAGKIYYKLPDVVKKELLALEKIALKHRPSAAHWDRRWRFVSFDIPETQRKYRDTLRWKLKRLGLEQFQQSLWVSPNEPGDEFDQIIAEGGLQDRVLIIDTDRIPNEDKWKRQFGLN